MLAAPDTTSRIFTSSLLAAVVFDIGDFCPHSSADYCPLVLLPKSGLFVGRRAKRDPNSGGSAGLTTSRCLNPWQVSHTPPCWTHAPQLQCPRMLQ